MQHCWLSCLEPFSCSGGVKSHHVQTLHASAAVARNVRIHEAVVANCRMVQVVGVCDEGGAEHNAGWWPWHHNTRRAAARLWVGRIWFRFSLGLQNLGLLSNGLLQRFQQFLVVGSSTRTFIHRQPVIGPVNCVFEHLCMTFTKLVSPHNGSHPLHGLRNQMCLFVSLWWCLLDSSSCVV